MPQQLKTVKMSRAECMFRAGDIEIFAPGEADGPRKFRILARSTKPIARHWSAINLIHDIDGLKPDSERMPVLFEHETDRIVGQTTATSKEKKGFIVDGEFSKSSPEAAMVQAHADEGFPWQASIYAPPLKIEYVDAGASAEVNGYKVKGPATIVREARVREVSFCTLGADANTKGEALSGREEEFEVEITTNPRGKEDENMENDTQVVELEAKDKVATVTLSEFRSARPELVKEIEGEAAKLAAEKAEEKALKGERKRIADVCGNAPKGMSTLALECLVDGKSVEEAKTVFLKALEAAAETTLGAGDEEQEGSSDGIELSVEDQAKKDYKEKAKLREEFQTEGSYVAFMKHDDAGDIKILSNKEKE